MSEQTDRIKHDLIQLGLEKEEAEIYLYLKKKGLSTALEVSKNLSIGRTKVYRITDKLYKLGLIEQVMKSRGFKFKATSSLELNKLLLDKKLEVNKLESLLPLTISKLENLETNSKEDSNVKYYKGIEGLKQVTWNSLKAKKEILIYEMVSDMSKFLDKEFSEEVRLELVKRKIKTKQLTNHKSIKEYIKVTQKVLKYWEVRFIDPKDLKLSYEFLVYNNTVAMYNVQSDNVFCVEIIDKRLANMQKMLFNFVWKNAKSMKIVNEFGRAELT